MTERALATIRRISSIDPIPEADAIEVATVDGWKVVVRKGEFSVDDLAVYFEIDSWIPHTLAPFLTKPGRNPKLYKDVLGQRLKTVKIRGQISQGLLLPLSTAEQAYGNPLRVFQENNDLTEALGIQKWEPEVPAQLAGLAKGNFPSFIPKTDQPRIQNLKRQFEDWKEKQVVFQVTEKLDGSSMTVFRHPETQETCVCSRNLELKFDDQNTFWNTCIKEDLGNKLVQMHNQFGTTLALQGELCGPGIQGNKYNLPDHQFFLYDIYEIDNNRYLPPDIVETIAYAFGVKHVPTLGTIALKEHSIETLLELAEYKSALNPQAEREGLVFKSLDVGDESSFKVISNKWLLKNE